MKRISALMILAMIASNLTCNNDKKRDGTGSFADAALIVPEIVFSPFNVMIIQQRVKNFGRWKLAYLAFDSMRMAHGISSYRIGRGLTDTNWVIVMDKVSDVIKAKEFSSMANHKNAMQKAGVIADPKIAYVNMVRNDDAHFVSKSRLMVMCKVGDYSSWLKAYDGEGNANRVENGLTDHALGKRVDDPNTVYMLFVVADVEKVKKLTGSAAFKKVIAEPGGEGVPQLFYYRIDD